MYILSIMPRLGFGSNSLLGLDRAGRGMEESHRGVLLVWSSLLPCTSPGVGIGSPSGGRGREAADMDNLKCVSNDDYDLLEAARFSNTFVRLVGQAPAPSQCILLSTSAEVRVLFKGWVLSETGDKSSVKLDTRDLGGRGGEGHLDTIHRRRSSTLAGELLGCWLLFWWLWHCHLILLVSLGFYGPSFCLGLYMPLKVLGFLLDFCCVFDLPLSLPLGDNDHFWPDHFWPSRLLARRLLAQTSFGPNHFWPRPLWPAQRVSTFGPLTIQNVKTNDP